MMETQGADPRNDLSNYEPLVLATQEAFARYWGATAPLLQRCIDKAFIGEMDINDIKDLAFRQQFFVVVLKSDLFETPMVKFAMVLEVKRYPRFAAMNVVAIGGENLKALLKRVWPHVQGYAYILGIRCMECSVSAAMERVLQGVGFKRRSVNMYQFLGGEDDERDSLHETT